MPKLDIIRKKISISRIPQRVISKLRILTFFSKRKEFSRGKRTYLD